MARLEPLAPTSFQETLRQTLICFVLVNSQGQHQFCSRYDFGPWPLLAGVDSLPPGVLKVITVSLFSLQAQPLFQALFGMALIWNLSI